MSNKASVLSDRYAKAYEMREKGATYKEIGAEIGTGPQRARQIVLLAGFRLKQPPDPWAELSTRARNVLRAEGYDTKEKAIEGIMSGVLHPDATYPNEIPNYGRKTHKEVCDWLGIQLPDEETEKDKRYAKYLRSRGYTVTKNKKA